MRGHKYAEPGHRRARRVSGPADGRGRRGGPRGAGHRGARRQGGGGHRGGDGQRGRCGRDGARETRGVRGLLRQRVGRVCTRGGHVPRPPGFGRRAGFGRGGDGCGSAGGVGGRCVGYIPRRRDTGRAGVLLRCRHRGCGRCGRGARARPRGDNPNHRWFPEPASAHRQPGRIGLHQCRWRHLQLLLAGPHGQPLSWPCPRHSLRSHRAPPPLGQLRPVRRAAASAAGRHHHRGAAAVLGVRARLWGMRAPPPRIPHSPLRHSLGRLLTHRAGTAQRTQPPGPAPRGRKAPLPPLHPLHPSPRVGSGGSDGHGDARCAPGATRGDWRRVQPRE